VHDDAFGGLIDEAAVYNVALTPAEIQAQVAAALATKSPVQTISPTSRLDIQDAVIIDGYTQPGAKANTLASGDNAVLLIDVNGDSTIIMWFNLSGSNSTMRVLGINVNVGAAIYMGIVY